ncbi:MAG TPA: hypothetical protein VNF68_08440, partial [Candidatus Baltobacteraceae bacterium]|nr:hypothetical protein [Candidatus Baltobacteraceae bacterium]
DVVPIYAPALVAFFGFGNAFGLGFDFGNVGWVPLAPGDPFNPWWGGNNTTIIVNNTTIINNYQNVNHGLVGLPVVGWQNGNFNQITRLHTTQLRDVHPVVGRLPLNPTNNNYRFTRSPIGTTVAKPVYTRFRAIRPIVRAPVSTGWQRFTTTRTSPSGFAPTRRTNDVGTPTRGSAWQHFGTAPTNRVNAHQPTYQRPTYQRPTYQRPVSQRPQPTYQRPTYQRPTYQRPVSQRPQPTYQRSAPQQPQQRDQPPQQSYQRPTYQRQTSDQRSSAVTPSRAPRPRETARPHSHGPGTM